MNKIEQIEAEHVTCDSSVLRTINLLITEHNQMIDDLQKDFGEVVKQIQATQAMLNEVGKRHNVLANIVKEMKEGQGPGIVDSTGRIVNS